MYLEDIGEVSQVEDVVKLDGCRQECSRYLLVERYSSLDQLLCNPLH